jgi:hypothetical protein
MTNKPSIFRYSFLVGGVRPDAAAAKQSGGRAFRPADVLGDKLPRARPNQPRVVQPQRIEFERILRVDRLDFGISGTGPLSRPMRFFC